MRHFDCPCGQHYLRVTSGIRGALGIRKCRSQFTLTRGNLTRYRLSVATVVPFLLNFIASVLIGSAVSPKCVTFVRSLELLYLEPVRPVYN